MGEVLRRQRLGDKHTSISLHRDEKSESWVLTGYKIDYNTDAKGRGNDLSNATQIYPTPTREDLGAALKSNVLKKKSTWNRLPSRWVSTNRRFKCWWCKSTKKSRFISKRISRDGRLGNQLLRKGEYFDNRSLYVKTQRTDRLGQEVDCWEEFWKYWGGDWGYFRHHKQWQYRIWKSRCCFDIIRLKICCSKKKLQNRWQKKSRQELDSDSL